MKKIVKLACLMCTGTLMINLNPLTGSAATVVGGEQPLAGISVGMDNYYTEVQENKTVDTLSLFSVPINIPENLGIANVDNYLNVRSGPSEKNKIIGKLPKNAGCTVISVDENGWAKIKSGKVSGYVLSDYLIMGKKAEKMATEVGRVVATVTEGGTRIRETASTESPILDMLGEGEQFDVVSELVINKNDSNATTWVEIQIDNETGFISKDLVSLSYELKKAVSVEEITGVSSVRSNLISTAKKYLGNRYVYGGTSLTNGIDCSAYVRAIYSMYGYSLPRTSGEQSRIGTSISYSNAKPGDLLFYGNSSGITHVAMYIGNGQIIHASNPSDGIKISNALYRTPVKVVRVIND